MLSSCSAAAFFSVPAIYQHMAKDPLINHLVPFDQEHWNALSQDVRILMSVLYEEFRTKHLLTRAKLVQMPSKGKSTAVKRVDTMEMGQASKSA